MTYLQPELKALQISFSTFSWLCRCEVNGKFLIRSDIVNDGWGLLLLLLLLLLVVEEGKEEDNEEDNEEDDDEDKEDKEEYEVMGVLFKCTRIGGIYYYY